MSVSVPQNTELLEYKTIWCRLENGGYFFYYTYPSFTVDRLVNEFNEDVPSGRRYYAFPMGFDPSCMGSSSFAPILVQAIEDHLQNPSDIKYRRIKEQVISLAILEHGMSLDIIKTIGQEVAAVYQNKRGDV